MHAAVLLGAILLPAPLPTKYPIAKPYNTQKMKFSIKYFFSKLDQIRKKTVDLVTFANEILNGKLRFYELLEFGNAQRA